MQKNIFNYYFLCILSLVISLVGLNIHIGITIYLSRLIVLCALVYLLLGFMVGCKIYLPKHLINIFIPVLFFLLLLKVPSVLLADSLLDASRQLAIYSALVLLFILVLLTGKDANSIKSALKIYVYVGIFQGFYGIYQTIGPFYSWPTYQTFLEGIPMANDRTTGGYYWSGAHGMFRATGFFSADVSHYAIYLATVFLISLSFLYCSDRRKLGVYGLFFSFTGILLSLSRSGLLSLIIFGMPLFFFIKSRIKNIDISLPIRKINLILFFVIFVIILTSLTKVMGVSLHSYSSGLLDRLADLINPGESNIESMTEHIRTRMVGIDAFLTNPLFGVGMGENAAPWYSENYNEYWAGSHSHHLNILGESGFIGALFEWIFMYVCLHIMYLGIINKKTALENRVILAGILSACLTLVLGNFLYHSFLNDFVWYLFGIGVALSFCNLRVINSAPQKSPVKI